MVDNEYAPHIVFDTTKSPVMSEITKAFTSSLALPTVSGAFGQTGDIYQWRDISVEKQNYLLQIMPPSDIIPEVIRSIAIKTNITNAGILFDESFGKGFIIILLYKHRTHAIML